MTNSILVPQIRCLIGKVNMPGVWMRLKLLLPWAVVGQHLEAGGPPGGLPGGPPGGPPGQRTPTTGEFSKAIQIVLSFEILQGSWS